MSLSASAVRTDRKWPDNQVYYTLNNVNSTNRQIFMSAINGIQEKTYLTFYQRYRETNYIEVKYHNTDEWIAYSDWIGMKGGKQEINLSSRAWNKGTIIHEICHALGLYHGQCRVDRDSYLNVNLSQLTHPNDIYQFKTYKDIGQKGRDLGEFDFNSIMLYSFIYSKEK